MPTLHFKGKTFVQNHHLAVKYHQLVPKKELSLTDNISLHDNLIIQGDNLKALKALLPTYAGKVKCIYIDPPYNTGNENWVYNDNVNSPMLKEWLGKVVDKEDMTRHDKWLCMMMPRLKLLRELLSEDGVIFISIDDNEVQGLKVLMDEVFGETNFISCIVCQLNPRGRTLDKYLAKTHEYVLLYAKNNEENEVINLLEKEGKAVDHYSKKDETGEYRELELRNRNPVFTRKNRPNLYFPIYINPKTNKVSLEKNKEFSETSFPVNSLNEDGCWTWSKDKVEKNLNLLVGKQVSTGVWRVFRKDYLYGDDGEIAKTKAKALWAEKEINNENGKEVVKEIFGSSPFDFPKSVELLKKVIRLGNGDDSIVLDSFAGSGTTAHAVLELNKEDGGNRKFILVEQEDYANTITAERVRRVIKGVKTAKSENLKSGTGGTFSYFQLGESIEMESILTGKSLPSYEELARYIFYTATGQEFHEKKINRKTHFIGETEHYELYMLYETNIDWLKQNALTLDGVRSMPKYTGKQRLVFAPAKYVDDYTLLEYRIDFCQLPYEIYRIQK
ncbi:MAG: site-specific DNA-methyltransferase [Bacteroidia bacterium]|nr:site-specific DNA-methyltransferase [Bacteroidia bacterium]